MIPSDQWLHTAQRLAVGMRERVRHGREPTAALVVAHDTDKWWSYCHRCHDGGVVPKTHITWTGQKSPEAARSNMSMPQDLVPAARCTETPQLAQFLAAKGMDFIYIPFKEAWYSPGRKRLVLRPPGGPMGRDVTGNALEKWLTYGGQHYIGHIRPSFPVVVVEDAFSMYKVQHAVADAFSVVSSLGTRLHTELLVRLQVMKVPAVTVFYDGDRAGLLGATQVLVELRGTGIKGRRVQAPQGLDPKDMTLDNIREALL